jgi:hypothetical protein
LVDCRIGLKKFDHRGTDPLKNITQRLALGATRTKGSKSYNHNYHNRNYPRFHNSPAFDIRFLALEKTETFLVTVRMFIA